MATSIAKLERNLLLLLKVIEAQQSLKSLDAAKTVEEWPSSVGPSPSPRMISEYLRAIVKDAVKRELVHADFKIPCSNYYPPKGPKTGQEQDATPSVKKRAREEADEDDMMHTTDDEVVKTKKTKRGGATKSNNGYLTPSSVPRFKSRSTIADVAGATVGLGEKAGNDRNDSDSDSDSLADLEDTPTKAVANKQRTLPARRTRAARKDYAEEDCATGELDESDEDFDPFRMRQEKEKQEARKRRARCYADNYDSD